MNDEHIDSLRQARALLIEQRRAFVRVLAGPYDRGKTEQAREGFTETQAATRPWTGPLKTKRGRNAQSTIEAEPNTRLLVAHVRRIRFPLNARAYRAWPRYSVRPDWAPIAKPALTAYWLYPRSIRQSWMKLRRWILRSPNF